MAIRTWFACGAVAFMKTTLSMMRVTVCLTFIFSLCLEPQALSELGLLVWQDFQMTRGIYPGKDDFPESFQAEAEDNIRRLRHHPSLVLFCGGNENYQQIRRCSE
jgi:hypothetical protein